jgi:hypothetical protein
VNRYYQDPDYFLDTRITTRSRNNIEIDLSDVTCVQVKPERQSVWLLVLHCHY